MATVIKGSRRVTKFRGGYKDPHSFYEGNIKPDPRLPGSGCIKIDYEEWTDMDTIEAFQKRYAAFSYKHDLRYPDREKGQQFRSMRAPSVVVDEAVHCMREMGVDHYWHDGGDPLWKAPVPNCKGSYPYLLDGGQVVIIPPFCSDQIIDVRSWCPNIYPEAARGMLVMSRYKIVAKDGNRFLKRRRKAGVPSVAWGDANRVWLLCEAFCGALRGEIYLSQRSYRRYVTFIEEIDFAIEGLGLLQARKQQRKPGIDIPESIQQLRMVRSDVVEYLEIITNKEVRTQGARLSEYFVERMAVAGSSYESDRILLGAVTTFLLEQKFGMGVSPQDALRELEYSEDPFVTALTVSSIGNRSFPYGMTKTQAKNAIFLSVVRSVITQHITLTANAILNQWPQPQNGLCYAGSMTNSAWKNIFLRALHEGRCMLAERDQEKDILKVKGDAMKRFLQSESFRSAQEKHMRYRFWRVILSPRACFSEPKANDPLFRLFTEYDFSEMPEINIQDLRAQAAFQDAYPKRQAGIRELELLWADRQKRYKIVVSGKMPVAIHPEGHYYILYLMDTQGLDGIHLEAVEALTRNKEALLVIERDDDTYELAKSYHGRQIQFDVSATPLLQVVISTEIGHLVAMRRVWSLGANSRVSLAPSKLGKIDANRDDTDPKALIRGDVFQSDACIPISLSEDKMKEFAPKYSLISTTHGAPVSPRSVRSVVDDACSEQVWASIATALYSPWDDKPFPQKTMTVSDVLQQSSSSSRNKRDSKTSPKKPKQKKGTSDVRKEDFDSSERPKPKSLFSSPDPTEEDTQSHSSYNC